VPVKEIFSGSSFVVLAWGTDEKRITLEAFFKTLKKSGHKDLLKALSLLKLAANGELPKNSDLVKKLQGKHIDGIFEFRANSIRIFWFYDGNNIICTHGIIKKTDKTPKKEIEYANSVKARYGDEKQRKQGRE
jgi:phage-related protein